MFKSIIQVPGEEKIRQTFWHTMASCNQWIDDQGKLPEGSVIKVIETVDKLRFKAIVTKNSKGELVYEHQQT